jgi:hypothetical protein
MQIYITMDIKAVQFDTISYIFAPLAQQIG